MSPDEPNRPEPKPEQQPEQPRPQPQPRPEQPKPEQQPRPEQPKPEQPKPESKGDERTTTTMTKDFLGIELVNATPGTDNATDHLGRAVGTGDTDYLGRALQA